MLVTLAEYTPDNVVTYTYSVVYNFKRCEMLRARSL